MENSATVGTSAPPSCISYHQILHCFKMVTFAPLPLPRTEIEMEIVNSCEKNNGGCSHHCHHSTNGPVCSCNHGYRLDQDFKTCVGKKSVKFKPHCQKVPWVSGTHLSLLSEGNAGGAEDEKFFGDKTV